MRFASALFLGALLSQPSFADTKVQSRDIDLELLNQLFDRITAEVIKKEQVKDEEGEELIDSVRFRLDPKSVLEKDKESVSVTASVLLNSSTWEPSEPSSLDLNATAVKIDAQVARISLSASIDTNSAALVSFAVSEWLKQRDPCSPERIRTFQQTKGQEFRAENCVDLRAMTGIKDTGEFIALLTKIVDRYESATSGAIEDEKSETAPDKDAIALLEERLRYFEILGKALHGSSGKDSVNFVIDDLDLLRQQGVDITKIELSVTPDTMSVGIVAESAAGRMFFDSALGQLETWSSVASKPEGDKERRALEEDFRQSFTDLVNGAKEIILPKAKSPAK